MGERKNLSSAERKLELTSCLQKMRKMDLFSCMRFETETSKYEAKIDQNNRKFVLKKKKVERGQSSAVAKGQEFIGNKLVITSSGNVELYNEGSIVLRTSPLRQDPRLSI